MKYNPELHKFKKIGFFYQIKDEQGVELFYQELNDFKLSQGDDHFEIFSLMAKDSTAQDVYPELFTPDFQLLYAILEDSSEMVLKCQISEIGNIVEHMGITFEVLDAFHKQRILKS